MLYKNCIRVLGLCSLLVFACDLPAAEIHWTGNGENNHWINITNWDSFTVPGTSDDVTIDKPGTNDVLLEGTFFAHNLTLGGDATTLTLTGNGLLVCSGSASIGTNAIVNSSGTLSVEGSMSLMGGCNWMQGWLGDDITIGSFGWLNIIGSQTKVLAGPLTNNGLITVWNAEIGAAFSPKVQLVNQSTMVIRTNFIISAAPGFLDNRGTILAPADGGTVVLAMDCLTNTGTIRAETNATLEIRPNSQLKMMFRQGTIFNGPGLIRFVDAGGGAVALSGTVTLNTTVESTGILFGSDGSFVTSAFLGGPGLFRWLGGYLGGVTFNPELQVEIAGYETKYIQDGCTNLGTVRWIGGGGVLETQFGRFVNFGTFIVQSNAVVQSGHFDNVGTLELNRGGLMIENGPSDACHFSSDSIIQVDLGSATPWGLDGGWLGFWYNAPLAGTLKVVLTNGLQPSAGQTFPVMEYFYLDGQFSSIQYPSLPDGLGWLADYGTGVLTLMVGQSAPMESLVRTDDGTFQFSITNDMASKGVVQATTNLDVPVVWEDLATYSPFAGPLVFSDLQATNYPQRFYRALLVP